MSRNARDRPLGLAPRGTAWGFGATTLIWQAVPAFTGVALCPFARDWLQAFIASFILPVVATIVIVALVIGFKSRRYWGVVAYFWGGAIAMAMPVIGSALIGGALLLHAGREPPLVGMTYAFGVPVVLSLLLLLPIRRALRLRYWQPWTTPDQWEIGDERTPSWFLRAAGRGDLADRNESERMRSTTPPRPRHRRP